MYICARARTHSQTHTNRHTNAHTGQWRLQYVLRLWRRAFRVLRWVGVNISRCYLRRTRALALQCCQAWHRAVAMQLKLEANADKALAASCTAASRGCLSAWRSVCEWIVSSSASLYRCFQRNNLRRVMFAWCSLRGMRSGERVRSADSFSHSSTTGLVVFRSEIVCIAQALDARWSVSSEFGQRNGMRLTVIA